MPDCCFPEVEERIEQLRAICSPDVGSVLGLLSMAEKACWQGDMNKARYYERRALEYEVR